MELNSKAWTGREARSSYPSVTELIDKYLPRKTRAEVYAMSRAYEDRITDLMHTIHDYHLRCEAMAKHMDGMEKEFYSRVAWPVSHGTFDSAVEINPMNMTQSYQVEWRPETYRARYVMRESDLINERDHPHLFEMVCRQFEEHITRTLIPKLRLEFAKLYSRTTR
ncbi:hypothetical protein Lo5R7ANS_28 [Mesorhizobium phage vB_MloP_Lo5R7ANS]|uniref:Uncharacterized protein n=1 Tax=Mesorhizobium phage vB_MloP_Lo5R7ANS TaxID=1527771 RepID=A0A076YJ38_9CAUD|nr:hypothetical protein Lo5R7ANS_28 [Mesorhizobium phage vB_MloP_Lo5R7ANS]AIK68498.1 hypothetical protein Lo5R7ANS_28 [Mesorhizobium phage vB_MloP_Lo5R7ANS]